MPSWFLPQASTYAAKVDNLILLITVVVGFWFIVAEVLLFWLMFRFRARDGVRSSYITGDEARQKRWVSWPHYAVLVFDVVLIAGALRVWHEVKVETPQPDETVRIVSQQWAWTFVQPGPDRTLDTADDITTIDELHVQNGLTYHFELHSRDVVHSFSVPAFRLKQDAVPGRTIRGWFRPTQAGVFDVQCAEMCGVGHALMPARIHIETAEQHAAWMATNPGIPTTAVAANASLTSAAPGEIDEEVRIVAHRRAWRFVQAGADRTFDTADDVVTTNELHVARDRVYGFSLTSEDVVHSFAVPAFRLAQDAVPGRTLRGWFKPTLTGTFDIECDDTCGVGAAGAPARIHIETAQRHAATMARLTPQAPGTVVASTAVIAPRGESVR